MSGPVPDAAVFKTGPSVPIPQSWLDACTFCGEPITDGPVGFSLVAGSAWHDRCDGTQEAMRRFLQERCDAILERAAEDPR